jgi:signal transduction histidine kinase
MRVAERFLKLYRDRTMVVGFVALAAVVLLVGIEHACARVTTGSPSLGSQDLVALGYALAAGGLGLWAWRLRRRGSRRPIASLCLATALFAASLAIAVDVIGQDTAVSMPEVYFVMMLLAFAGLLPLPPARFIAVAVPGVAGAIGMVLLVGPGGTPLLRAAIVATAALIAVAMAHLNFRRIRSMFASRLRAEDAVVERDEFVRILAHDLRNPIGALPDFASLIRYKHDADPGGDLTTELDVLESTARGVRSQLDNVLLWGHAGEGRLEVDDGVVDVPDLVRSIAESVAAHAHLKDIDLVTDAPSVLPVRSDAGLLRAIVRNLVDNALKFTKPGGRVSVTCRLENGSALIAVEDDGIGMETGDDQPQRSGTGGERGSGLGLSLVRTLVTRIGATMTIESQPGSGTAVRIRVPVGIETFERASSSAGAPAASPA